MQSLLFALLGVVASCMAANQSVLPLNIPPSLFWYGSLAALGRDYTDTLPGTATMGHGQHSTYKSARQARLYDYCQALQLLPVAPYGL